jgi:hypothetical protein
MLAELEKETIVQYVADAKGKLTGVIVPIELWQEITSELETSYLLRSSTMRQRLLQAINRQEGIPIEDAFEKLGI